MGVKQFFQLFDGEEVSLPDLKDTTIAVDCMTEIYRAALGMPLLNSMTDDEGNSTGYINIIVQTVSKFMKCGIDLLYVFDPQQPPKLKAAELTRRKNIRTSDGKRAFQVTSEMIKNVQLILSLMGVPYIVSPPFTDAEQICAILNANGEVDHIMTTDSDAFMYGGDSVLKWEKKKLILYTRDKFKAHTGLTNDQMLLLGVCLGTDFCNKTPGIGKGTVVKKCISQELTSEQLAAIELFNSKPIIPKRIKPTKDIPALLLWLESKNFNRTRMEKILLK